jgi:hypothetical protein
VDDLDRRKWERRKVPDENGGDRIRRDATERKHRGPALETRGMGAAWRGWIDDGRWRASSHMRTTATAGCGMRPVADGGNRREAGVGQRVGSRSTEDEPKEEGGGGGGWTRGKKQKKEKPAGEGEPGKWGNTRAASGCRGGLGYGIASPYLGYRI